MAKIETIMVERNGVPTRVNKRNKRRTDKLIKEPQAVKEEPKISEETPVETSMGDNKVKEEVNAIEKPESPKVDSPRIPSITRPKRNK